MYSVYLGAAIDLATELKPFDVMTDIVTKSHKLGGSVIFRPDLAYKNAHKAHDLSIPYLMNVNNFALDAATVAIFYISPKVYSQGAAMEISRRLQQQKPTLIVAEKVGLYMKGLALNGYGKIYPDFLELEKNLEFDVKSLIEKYNLQNRRTCLDGKR